MFSEIDGVSGDQISKSNSMAAYFHGLTSDSYGVLADTRTGGLKRDLSSAFAIKSDSSTSSVEKDFKGYLYQDRIYYMKNISFQPNAFANVWNDQSSGQFSPSIDDKNAILTGPRWSILKDFHNKWEDLKSSSSMLTEDESLPDDFQG